MYKNGFLKVAVATPKIIVGNINHNKEEVIKILNDSNNNFGILVFPELTLTGYSMGDLFFQTKTINDTLNALSDILKLNKFKGLAAIGLPLEINNILFNVAVVIKENKILGVIPKYHLPNNYEYNEKRWFESGYNYEAFNNKVNILGNDVPFGEIIFKEESKGILVGVEICQDMWQLNPPSNNLAANGANIILNLSASSELVNKDSVRKQVVLENSRRQMGAYLYTTSGMYESSSEHLFTSHKIITSLGKLVKEDNSIDYNGSILVADININEINFKRRQDSNYRSEAFNNNEIEYVSFKLEENNKYQIDKTYNIDPFYLDEEGLNKAYEILVASLVRKLEAMPEGNRKIILGLSGGLDSLHAIIIAHSAITKLGLPLDNLIPVIMPTKESSDTSMKDALEVCEKLNLKHHIINIDEEVKLHLKLINHDLKDVTYENTQARIRTLVLMNYANKYQGFVLGTGDLSEIALGFMTYNGDQMSMYAINSGLPKTAIRALTTHYANNKYSNLKDVLLRIVNKKVSPELIKDQVTEDLIGLYEINDFIMYSHLNQGLEEDELVWLVNQLFDLSLSESKTYVKRFLQKFYTQSFKRTTMPEGPKVFDISLSPRNSFKQPSDVYRK